MRRLWKGGFILWTLFFAFHSAVLAAEKSGFGFQGGLTLTDHWSTKEKSGDFTVESTMKDGFSAGIFAAARFSGLFSLEADLLYVKKGSNQTITVPGFPFGPIKVTYALDYLEIPLLLRTHPFPKAKTQLSLAAGPYIAFLVGKKYTYRIAVVGSKEEEIQGLKSTDFGVAFGTGVVIPAKIGGLKIDYRYTMGFTDLKLPTGPGFPEIELRNYGHYLMFGLLF